MRPPRWGGSTRELPLDQMGRLTRAIFRGAPRVGLRNCRALSQITCSDTSELLRPIKNLP